MQKIAFTIFLLVTFASCKKEEAAFPYNEIRQFSIQTPDGTSLRASINNNEIILYWPPLIAMPDSITPQIAISDRAMVEPASGSKVPFKDGVQFKVTAQNGASQTYTLRAGSNQPVPVFDVSSPEFLYIDRPLDLRGEYFIADTTKTKLFLINKDNQAVQLPGISFVQFYTARISAPIPFTVDTGHYKVRLVTGVRTVERGPFYINRPYLSLVTVEDAGKQKKAGENSVIQYSGPAAKYYHNSFTEARAQLTIQKSSGLGLENIPITKTADGTLNFTIPANAIGKIISILITEAGGNLIYLWEAPAGSEIEIIE